MITLQRCIVLAFSTNIVVTSFVLVILIPAWTTPILYVTAILTYIFGIVILSSYPELAKGHSYMLLLTIMNTAMFATIARVFGGTMDKSEATALFSGTTNIYIFHSSCSPGHRRIWVLFARSRPCNLRRVDDRAVIRDIQGTFGGGGFVADGSFGDKESQSYPQ